MIDHQMLLLFLGSVLGLLVVPGPDMLLIVSQSIGRGARFGAACSFGIMLAGLIQTALVATGLGRAMEMWPLLATCVRLVGAAYLAYLGFRLILAWWRSGVTKGGTAAVDGNAGGGMVRLMLVGLANNLLNPKALLFFSLFLPQFVNSNLGHASQQLWTLGLVLTIVAFAFNLMLSIMCSSLRRMQFRMDALRRHSGGLLGALFVLLASRLAFARLA